MEKELQSSDLNTFTLENKDKPFVHVWQANLSTMLGQVGFYQSFLNKIELDRSSNFYFEKHQKYFTLGRGILRFLLAKYTGIKPDVLEFKYNEFKKPFLINQKIYFNISHSEDYIVFMISNLDPIGIDIEYIDRKVDFKALVHRYFTKQEIEIFNSVIESDKKASFYKGWTCKEALLKAIGQGISFGLDNISVDMNPDKLPELLDINYHIKEWFFYEVETYSDCLCNFVLNENISSYQIYKV